MSKKYDSEAADKMIREFSQKFFERFDIYPAVIYTNNKIYTVKTGLLPLEQLVNELLIERIIADPDLFDKLKDRGIKTRIRNRTVVIYRQIFVKVAHDLGYGPSVIANHLGFDHATAIHSTKTINNLLDIKDPQIVLIYTQISNAYKKRFSNDGDVQSHGEGTAVS